METAARSQNEDVPPLLQAIASLYSSVYFVVFTCMHSMVDMHVDTQAKKHTHTLLLAQHRSMHVQLNLCTF